MMLNRRVIELTKGIKCSILFKALLGVAVSGTYVAQAVLLGKIVGQLYSKEELSVVIQSILYVSAVIASRLILIYYNSVYGKKIIGKVKNILRRRIYDKLLKLGPAFLDDERTGKLGSTMVSGVDYLEGYLTLYIPQILVCVIACGAMLIYVFSLHYVLGIISTAALIAVLISPVAFGKILSESSNAHWTAYRNLTAEILDGIQGITTAKTYNAQERLGKLLKEKMRTLFSETMRNLKVNLAEIGISNFASGIGTSFTLAVAALLTSMHIIPASSLLILLFMTNEVFRPANELAAYFHQGFMGITSMGGIFALLDEEEKIKDEGTKTIDIKSADGFEIKYKNIEFAYNRKKNTVFKNLNFTVAKNEKLAVAGESGSGKTTIVNLLLRFYEPTSGSIYINGTDIKDLTLKSLRSLITVVSQETYLFNGTIKENLLHANEDADEEKLIDACKAANIHSFIQSLPEGYNTKVGERGLNFSGGQRQRIAIARAVLKNSPIVVLDEATSSVDTENENEIKQSLNHLLRNRTSITIAHRLNTIENSDRILVLLRGEIVEEGSHKELILKDGYYKKLVEAQQGEN
ncbi:ABC transporter ATP-binding protein/permease [Treponema denticola]|uniref:ABC transporter ATP-binding protein n=1 Tax=Treponema denticola TaxID=158 RepID=UPI0021F82778|nr:ABC transporter ATP-binding protein [Treponema denticola]UYT08260.1 ABC transporter ATP-binding protein/permease [Treponema denticola]